MARILIIDDKPHDRIALQSVLQDTGYSVAVAEQEDVAFRLLSTDSFDLLLLDLELPKKGGSQTLVRLARHHPGLKVLVTARGGETISTRAYLDVADDRGTIRTLPKPFDRSRLLRAIDAMLHGTEWHRKEPPSDTDVSNGGL